MENAAGWARRARSVKERRGEGRGALRGGRAAEVLSLLFGVFLFFFFAFFPRQASPFDANGAGMHRLTRVGEPQSLR